MSIQRRLPGRPRTPPSDLPAPLPRAQAIALAAVLDALADPVRLRVYRAVLDAGDRGVTIRQLVGERDRATVREALHRLEAVGVLRRRTDRRWVLDQWTAGTLDGLLGPVADGETGDVPQAGNGGG